VYYKEGIIIRVKHFYRIVSYRRQSRRIRPMQSFLFRSFVLLGLVVRFFVCRISWKVLDRLGWNLQDKFAFGKLRYDYRFWASIPGKRSPKRQNSQSTIRQSVSPWHCSRLSKFRMITGQTRGRLWGQTHHASKRGGASPPPPPRGPPPRGGAQRMPNLILSEFDNVN